MKKLLFAGVLVGISTSLFAWGRSAHLIIGHIAESYLSDKAKAEVKKILGTESIGEAGTWLDDISKNSDYKKQDNWHFAYKDQSNSDDALAKLTEFKQAISDPNASAESKLFALRALIHIAGDVHNPIHCGFEKDHGGHKARLKWQESGEKTNLHKVWDTDMILMKEKEVDTYANDLKQSISDELSKKWGTDNFAVWVQESHELLDQVYDFKGNVLTKTYYEQNITVVDERMRMAGVRLAFVLNEVFGM